MLFRILCLCFVLSSATRTNAGTTTTIVTTSSTTTTTTKSDPNAQEPEIASQTCPPLSHTVTGPSHHVAPTKQSEFVHISADPRVVHEGVTPQLTITCTFMDDPRAEVGRIIMMGVYRIRDEAPNAGKHEVATATATSTPPTITSGNAEIARRVMMNNLSYINITIKNPTEGDTGLYRCSIMGADTAGKEPFLVQAMASVNLHGDNRTISVPQYSAPQHSQYGRPISDAAGTNAKATEEINRQLRSLRTALDLVNVKLSAFEEVNLKLAALEKFKHGIELRLNSSKESMFEFHVDSNNIRYYVSSFDYSHHRIAQATCELYGGHLAEVDNQEEMDLLVNTLTELADDALPNVEGVLIGGSDEEAEGIWEAKFSSKLNLQWGDSFPAKDPAKNCIALLKSAEWKMSDQPCTNPTTSMRFFCEIPPMKA